MKKQIIISSSEENINDKDIQDFIRAYFDSPLGEVDMKKIQKLFNWSDKKTDAISDLAIKAGFIYEK